MGYVKGPWKFTGKIGGMVFSDTPHGTSAIEYTRLSKRRLKGPEFERSREMSTEFGGASALAKSLYSTLKKYGDVFRLRMWNDLQEETLRVLCDDKTEVKGKRCADFLTNGETALNFDMGFQSLDSILRFPYKAVIAEDRKKVSCLIPYSPYIKITGHGGEATAYKIFMTATVIPKLVLGKSKKYEPAGTLQNPIFYFTETFILEMDSAGIPEMELSIELENAPEATDAIVVCLGIGLFKTKIGCHTFVENKGGLKLIKIG